MSSALLVSEFMGSVYTPVGEGQMKPVGLTTKGSVELG